ncbi:MAG: prephenate dehydrogenase [Planctomycetota bacterium]|nr:prephenate dehydrogenase [Planctomycetota bacterium]
MPPGQEDSTYRTVSVVGLGLIGGSLALALRRAGFQGAILGVSRPESLEKARRLGAIDEGFSYEDIATAAARSDLIVLATPISRIVEHLDILGQTASNLRRGTVVTDVGSTKKEILEKATASLPEGVHFIGGHPLAGSEQRGIGAADPFLFQNAYYVLTPAEGVPPRETDRLASFLGSTGARIVVLPATEHDRVAAVISHLPQLLAVTLVNFLEELDENREAGVRLAAGGFRDMTRIASSPFSVWRDILASNREEVLRAVERFAKRLGEETKGLDDSRLDASFEKAARARAEIPRDTKGFLNPLWDVFVEVEDVPGTISRLANPLTAKGINIKDIEVLKVREGEGGTLRLAFASRKLAHEALDELRRSGFKARLRE